MTEPNSRRIAIVTGGTRGIGAAISERLVKEGAHVAAIYAGNEASAQAMQARLASGPGTLSIHKGDIGDRATCMKIAGEVIATHGRVDWLVNNAGLLIENKLSKMSGDEWERAIAVNLSGSFYLSQAVVDGMVERGFGRIVHIGSITAHMGNALQFGYGAAKAGLEGLTRSMARALIRKGVTVNVVVPGVYETDMANSMDPAMQEVIRKLIPMGRRGRPEELAHIVCSLLDERASYISGQTITVDGGISWGA